MRFTTRVNTGSIDNNKDTKWALTGWYSPGKCACQVWRPGSNSRVSNRVRNIMVWSEDLRFSK